MSDADPPGSPAQAAYRHGRRLVRGAYRSADAVVDVGQAQAFRLLWLFLPETSVTRNVHVQALLVSRFFSDAGQQALAYGALIAVIRGGGSAFDAALIGAAAVLPPALLGLYGGAVADALPRRIALGGVYILQALLCFAAPGLLGTGLAAMVALLIGVNILGQVSQPTESSVMPLVTSDTQLATGTALLSFVASLGTAFGTALLAPVLVRAFGVDTVIYVAGVMLMIAASRVLDVRAGNHHEEEPRVDISSFVQRVSIRDALRWLSKQPAVATMVVVAVIAGTAQIVLQTLAPRYVSSVLDADPADSVYVFAPSAIGLTLALAAAPALIRRRGERWSALLGFSCVTVALMLLGAIRHVDVIDVVNPLRALSLAEIDLSPRLRTAMLLALPLGFGVSLTLASVQTYINRRVPLHLQGRAFALQGVIKNATAIVPLLALGAAAGRFGAEAVIFASPLLLMALALVLIAASRRFGEQAPLGGIEVLATFWEEEPGHGAPPAAMGGSAS